MTRQTRLTAAASELLAHIPKPDGLVCRECLDELSRAISAPLDGAGLIDAERQRQVAVDRSGTATWPWAKDSFKPGDPVERCLIKAGALIAAELDRRRAPSDG